MSLARVKSWIVETLTASDLNAEFNNILNYLNNSGVTLTSPTITTPVINGTTTNDSAGSGVVGQLSSSTLTSGSAVSLTTATAKTVTSVSLTAGDWDVEGIIAFDGNAATTVTALLSSISQTADTIGTAGLIGLAQGSFSGTVFSNAAVLLPTGRIRISLAGTTTVYLVARATFAVNSATAYGQITARRVR